MTTALTLWGYPSDERQALVLAAFLIVGGIFVIGLTLAIGHADAKAFKDYQDKEKHE